MRHNSSGVIVTPQTLSKTEPGRQNGKYRTKTVLDRATLDGEIREVETVDHVTDKELYVQENHCETVHLISNPEIRKGDWEERSKKDADLKVEGGERERDRQTNRFNESFSLTYH